MVGFPVFQFSSILSGTSVSLTVVMGDTIYLALLIVVSVSWVFQFSTSAVDASAFTNLQQSVEFFAILLFPDIFSESLLV